MSGQMWKPGTAKPDHCHDDRTNRQSSTPQKPDNDEDDHHNIKPPVSTSSSTKKKLSGATMNMRFMQRKQERQRHIEQHQRLKQQQQSSTQGAAEDSMQVDTADNDTSTENLVHISNNGGHSLLLNATGSDMYGLQSDVIGRRSFGGFNRPVEVAWKESYRSHRDNSNHGRSIDDQRRQRASDDELLQRYAELVEHRKNDERGGGRGPSQTPNQRQQQSRGSGNKRKRR